MGLDPAKLKRGVWPQLPLTTDERRDGLRWLAQEKICFVLGKPRRARRRFEAVALKALAGRWSKLPIFVSLHGWLNSGLEPLDFIQQRLLPAP
ncbi:MAG: hypothetical protein H6668_01400 [Ardenticatenaceae bacterium]|nr:hypothetical protein [Ardenticatenaceae bacterium]